MLFNENQIKSNQIHSIRYNHEWLVFPTYQQRRDSVPPILSNKTISRIDETRNNVPSIRILTYLFALCAICQLLCICDVPVFSLFYDQTVNIYAIVHVSRYFSFNNKVNNVIAQTLAWQCILQKSNFKIPYVVETAFRIVSVVLSNVCKKLMLLFVPYKSS